MKLSLLLSIVLLILGSAYATRPASRGQMVLTGDSPRPARMVLHSDRFVPQIRCMAMTPSCMGQEAYDRWVNSFVTGTLSTSSAEHRQVTVQPSTQRPQMVLHSDAPIPRSMVLNNDPFVPQMRCRAMTPGCMGQEAYDRWIYSLKQEQRAPLDDDQVVAVKPQKKRPLGNKKRTFNKLPRYRCMAMTPGCMGQEAYDRWINSRKTAVVATTAPLDDNSAPVVEKKKKRKFKIRVCKALTPGCMGQKAYDEYMKRLQARRSSPSSSLSDDEQIRCKALTPFCMGQKAYDQFMAKLLM